MRFVDTNILVYAEQPAAGAKHDAACGVLRDIWQGRDGVVSAQALQEFYVTITRKMPKAYSPETALRILSNYLAWRVVPVDGPLVLDAVRIQQDAGLAYWDAAIVAAAVASGCDELLTEDLNDGQVIRGVRVRNPLAG
jgi:predicted nucleic acid-binding protein